MKGYWRKPDLTEKVLKDGWYRTSDMGALDEDGNLYITGRKDFLIKSGGFFIAPEEVEEVLQRHPIISEAAVIPIPDDKWGHVLKAIVCLKAGASLTAEEITEYLKGHLANYQVPKVIDFRDKLPREPATNKVIRNKLK
jgi:long-chain acyl-CoA synthetase